VKWTGGSGQLWSRHNGQQELICCQASKAPIPVWDVSLEQVKLSSETYCESKFVQISY